MPGKVGTVYGHALEAKDKKGCLNAANFLLKKLPSDLIERTKLFVDFICSSGDNEGDFFVISCSEYERIFFEISKNNLPSWVSRHLDSIKSKLTIIVGGVADSQEIETILRNNGDLEQLLFLLTKKVNIEEKLYLKILRYFANNNIPSSKLRYLRHLTRELDESNFRIVCKILQNDDNPDFEVCSWFLKNHKDMTSKNLLLILQIAFKNKNIKYSDIEFILTFYGDGGTQKEGMLTDQHMYFIEQIEERS